MEENTTHRRCATCGQEFRLKSNKPNQRYCSHPCFYPSQRGRTAWNTSVKAAKACATCGTEMLLRPTLLERTKYCSRACTNVGKSKVRGTAHPLYALVPRTCEHCGSHFMAKPAKVNAGEGRFCSRRCLGGYSVALQQGRRSSIEVMIEEELVKRGVPFEAQKAFRWYAVDFYIPHLRLVIECDGDYWHGTDKQIAKDRQKDEWLSKRGERVFRLKEHEIKSSPSAALDRALAS